MSFLLNGQSIRRPIKMTVSNDTQSAENRTLAGSVTRDFFGSNKKVWTLEYENTTKTDFDVIDAIYQSYLSTGTAQSWQITETNYTVSATTVHVDLKVRDFSVGGTDYLSDFTLTLKEA